MKLFAMVFLTLVLAKGCDRQLSDEMKKATIEYQATSRGYYLNINIQDEKLTMTRKRDGETKEYTLTNQDWKELANLYKTVDLDKLSEYKDPTQKRFYDGAAIANLRVVYEGKTYETKGFDHGNPPVEIAAFVNKIVSFSDN